MTTHSYVRRAGRGERPPELIQAIEAIDSRLRWASIHWTLPSPDAIPHIAASVLDVVEADRRKAKADALQEAAHALDLGQTEPHTREDRIGAAGAPDWLRDRAAAILEGRLS